MYSITVVTITEPKNSMKRLSFRSMRRYITPTRPKPYMGQMGPLRKPLFTNLPWRSPANATSAHQPMKAYTKNIQTS